MTNSHQGAVITSCQPWCITPWRYRQLTSQTEFPRRVAPQASVQSTQLAAVRDKMLYSLVLNKWLSLRPLIIIRLNDSRRNKSTDTRLTVKAGKQLVEVLEKVNRFSQLEESQKDTNRLKQLPKCYPHQFLIGKLECVAINSSQLALWQSKTCRVEVCKRAIFNNRFLKKNQSQVIRNWTTTIVR